MRKVFIRTPAPLIALALFQAVAFGQPQLAENVYKDIRLLKGMPVDQFLDTMGFFSASTNFNCIDCHGMAAGGDWSHYADETPMKATARRMILMVQELNQRNFGGRRIVTCYTCHRGDMRPQGTPSLAVQNSAPVSDPNEVVIDKQAASAPSADQVFGKYIQALGGAEALAGVKSLAIHGDYKGFDTEFEARPVDIYAKAPDRRAAIVHYRSGDGTTICDGRSAWIAEADKPVPLIELTGGALEGAKMDGVFWFPAGIRALRPTWKIGFTAMGEAEVVVAVGTGGGQQPLKLYFEKESGLLLRQVRYTALPIGLIPAQLDYDDYRVVSGTGIKVPYKITATWVDGRSTTSVTSVQANAPIEDNRFAKPAR